MDTVYREGDVVTVTRGDGSTETFTVRRCSDYGNTVTVQRGNTIRFGPTTAQDPAPVPRNRAERRATHRKTRRRSP